MEAILLADPKGNAWKCATEIYERLEDKGFKLVELEIKEFKDREKKFRISKNVRKRNCFFIHDSTKEPAAWFLEVMCVNEALKYASAAEITDVLPYILFSRQDRKDVSRVAISARTVAKGISLDADRVLTIDLHAPQIQGFYSIPVDNLYSFPTVVDYLKEKHEDFLEDLVIASTDAG